MDTLHFEASVVPARTVSLYELVYEQFLVKKPPKNSSDRGNICKAFEILQEMFGNLDTATFTDDHLLVFRNNLPERVSERTGKTYAVSYCNKLLGFVRAVFKWGSAPNGKIKTLGEKVIPLVSPALSYALSNVPDLEEDEGRQNPERKAAPVECIMAVLAVLEQHWPIIADMLRVQLLTGMRP